VEHPVTLTSLRARRSAPSLDLLVCLIGMTVIVKESVSRFAAQNLHPEAARERIREGAREAVARAGKGELRLPAIDLPARLDVSLQTADMAQMATWIRGVERTDLRTVRIEGDDPLALFRSFVGVVYLTRVAEGR
jgi:D-amino peptidase